MEEFSTTGAAREAATGGREQMQNSDAILPDLQGLCSGIGQFHTNEVDPQNPDKKLAPYLAIGWCTIQAMVDKPQAVDKTRAQWLIPSTLPSRNFKQQEANGEYWLLWADLDKNPPKLQKVGDFLEKALDGCDFEAYHSRSATAENQKARVLILLDKPLCFADWRLAQEILNNKLDAAGIIPDRASERAAQLCYLPNRGAFYDRDYLRDGNYFEPLQYWRQEITAKREKIEAEREALEGARTTAMAKKATLTLPSGIATMTKAQAFEELKNAFNAAYTPQEWLLQFGYAQRGNAFRHPGSEHGSFSCGVRLDDNGVLRAHTLSTSDLLHVPGSKSGHDAFSVYCTLFHGGDNRRAAIEAGDKLLAIGSAPWNQAKQRERAKSRAQSPPRPESEAEQPTPPPEPFPLDWPPGLAGEVARYIYDSSRMPVKSFAIAGALSALAFLNANKAYVKRSDTALNLYQCLIGGTGRGKEGPRQAVKRLANSAYMLDGIHEGIASAPGLLRSLTKKPESLILSDEFGLFLQVALSDKGSTHLKELVKELMTLFGLGRSFYSGKPYADGKLNIPRIDNPYVNLLGTTTSLELMDGITSKSIDNGFLNRILFIESSEENPINRDPDNAIPERILEAFKQIARAEPRGLDYEDGAHDLMIQFAETMGEPGILANLWRRAEEQMIRVAGNLALEEGVISREHVAWAFSYVEWCIKSFSARIGSELAETPFQKLVVKALGYIRDAKTFSSDKRYSKSLQKGFMPRGKLTKLMRIKSSELNEVILFLIESGQCKETEFDGVTQFSLE